MPDFRSLPSVDAVLRRLADLADYPAALITAEIRRVLAERRELLQNALPSEGLVAVEEEVRSRLRALDQPSLRRVINATGVILHTNLGRAPLGDFHPIGGWSNLEYDLTTGRRGKRDAHTAELLERLLERTAIVVNNNAAAVLLVLQELAQGGEVMVSRGELIEIGDGFRIPEIMAQSGAAIREVGTTNRTRVEDYRSAIGGQTRLILRVHPSNFHITGFASRPALKELCALGQERGIPVYEDLGSGCLVDLRSAGIHEPLVKESLAAGVNVVSFSCDKLLGGPQSGIIAGDRELMARVRRNPLYRALRVDKLIVEAMERTLRLLLFERWNEIPALRAIRAGSEEIHARAARVSEGIPGSTVRESESPVGGGSTPDQTLPTWLVEFDAERPDAMAAALRQGEVPVIVRIAEGKVVLDMRTAADTEVDVLIEMVTRCGRWRFGGASV